MRPSNDDLLDMGVDLAEAPTSELYFLIRANDNKLIEVLDTCPHDQEQQQTLAREFKCGYWIVAGQHTGIIVELEAATIPDEPAYDYDPAFDGSYDGWQEQTYP